MPKDCVSAIFSTLIYKHYFEMKQVTNIGKSIKMKLWNLAADLKRDKNDNQMYHLMLIRYIQERLLYRLGISQYRDNFYLKGGALLYSYDRFEARPTLDIDFLGNNTSREIDNLTKIMKAIAALECESDAITFLPDSLMAEEITVNKEYHGVRISIEAKLDTAVQKVSMDIGFGDVITPYPQELNYPVLIAGLPQPMILAYSLETVIAEKFEAMITLAEDNSRMKDFFDVYRLLTYHEIDPETLKEAIAATFENRQTVVTRDHTLFSAEFAIDARRQTEWKAFLKRIKWKEDLPFNVVMNVVRDHLMPYYESLIVPGL